MRNHSHSLEGASYHFQSNLNISILYFNARSLLPKLDLLKAEVVAHNPSVICIVESWLSENIDDNEISIDNYHITRLDRNRHGGGVLAYVHNSLTCEILLKGPNDLELIALLVSSVHTTAKHCISVLYRPPSSPVSFLVNLCTTLHHLSPPRFSNFVLIGDLNVNFCNRNHPLFCRLESILQLFSLSQTVCSPTHANPNGDTSLIDLALVSNTSLLLDCSTIPPLANSDHNGLKLSLKIKHNHQQVQQQPRTIWRYSCADFRKACELIDATDWDNLLPAEDVDLAAINWNNKFMDIMQTCIPQQTLRKRRNVPWLTKNITRYMKKRNAAFQAAKRSGKPELALKYRKLRNETVKLLRSAKRSYLQQLDPRNKKQFWKAVKILSNQQSTIPTLSHQGTTAESDREKATMLNDFFSTCFNKAIPPLPPSHGACSTQGSVCPDQLLCTTSEVLSYITSLDINKANGPDRVSARMLKSTAHSIAPSLTKLFNISISLGHFPQCWKMSSVVPIPKSSNHKEASNYRPISLLPVVSKLLERHFHQHITKFLNEVNPLCNRQWGFQPGKSTVTALLSVTHNWFKSLESGHDVCSIFFDLRKAFDSVPHRLLLDKLTGYGLDSHIVSWICSYLTDRKQHVVVGGDSSTNVSVLSGVPQGSVLGPLLFLIYIDDVAASTNLTEGSVLNIFADDMLLYRPVTSIEDLHLLQQDIDKISEWVNINHLSLNPVKCKSMMVSRKKNPTQFLPFNLNGSLLEHVDTFKYLGILLSSDLSWSAHVSSICAKAKKIVGLLYRRFSTNVDSQSLLEMYKMLVRPHMEYAAPVWDPHLLKDITKVENVQKFALKMCLKNWDSNYQDLLDLAQMPTLQNRRLYLKLCTLHKIIHGFFYFPPGVFIPQPSRHCSHTLPLLHQPLAHTNAYQGSFVPSTISVWNHLPHDALVTNSSATFKSLTSPLFL